MEAVGVHQIAKAVTTAAQLVKLNLFHGVGYSF